MAYLRAMKCQSRHPRQDQCSGIHKTLQLWPCISTEHTSHWYLRPDFVPTPLHVEHWAFLCSDSFLQSVNGKRGYDWLAVLSLVKGRQASGRSYLVAPLYMSSSETFSLCMTFSPRRSLGRARPPPPNISKMLSIPLGAPPPTPSLIASSPYCARPPPLRMCTLAVSGREKVCRSTHLVVYPPLFRVSEHLICCVDLLERFRVAT